MIQICSNDVYKFSKNQLSTTDIYINISYVIYNIILKLILPVTQQNITTLFSNNPFFN